MLQKYRVSYFMWLMGSYSSEKCFYEYKSVAFLLSLTNDPLKMANFYQILKLYRNLNITHFYKYHSTGLTNFWGVGVLTFISLSTLLNIHKDSVVSIFFLQLYRGIIGIQKNYIIKAYI